MLKERTNPTEQLEQLSDSDFRELVDRELRKDHSSTTPADRDFLSHISEKFRSPNVIDRWIAVLEAMKQSSETQLGAKKGDVKKLYGTITRDEYLARLRTYQTWRAGNVRFLHGVQLRLIDARRIKRMREGFDLPTRLVEERNVASQSLVSITKAVRCHRDRVLSEYDPTEADLALWSAVKEVRIE